MPVVGVPIGTEGYMAEHVVETARERREDCRVHRLAGMPDKQAVGFLSIEPFGQRATYLVKDIRFRWEQGWDLIRRSDGPPRSFRRPSKDGGT